MRHAQSSGFSVLFQCFVSPATLKVDILYLPQFCSGASSSKWEHQNWKPNSSKATLTPWPFEDQSFLYTFDMSTWIFQQVTFLHLSSWLTAVCQKPGYCAIYFKLVFLHNSKEPLNQGCGVYPCPLRDVDITFAMNNIKQSRSGIRLFFYTTAGYSGE